MVWYSVLWYGMVCGMIWSQHDSGLRNYSSQLNRTKVQLFKIKETNKSHLLTVVRWHHVRVFLSSSQIVTLGPLVRVLYVLLNKRWEAKCKLYDAFVYKTCWYQTRQLGPMLRHLLKSDAYQNDTKAGKKEKRRAIEKHVYRKESDRPFGKKAKFSRAMQGCVVQRHVNSCGLSALYFTSRSHTVWRIFECIYIYVAIVSNVF